MATAARMSTTANNISYSAELGRKAIHLSSLGIPLVAWFLPWDLAVAVLALMAAVSALVDIERWRGSAAGRLIDEWCGFMLRTHERHGGRRVPRLTGATWMLISAVLTFAIFPREVAVAAFTMLIVCDTAAALVGRRFGRIRFGPRRKSVEGSLAFFVSGVVVAALVPELPMLAGIAGALAATLAEALPYELDDNFSIPLTAGLVMMMLL
jgi:dolichol kinase